MNPVVLNWNLRYQYDTVKTQIAELKKNGQRL